MPHCVLLISQERILYLRKGIWKFNMLDFIIFKVHFACILYTHILYLIKFYMIIYYMPDLL